MRCENCDLEFEATRSDRRFCSKVCRKRAERKRWKRKRTRGNQQLRFERTGLMAMEGLCKICEEKFIRSANSSKYCSAKCRAIGYRIRARKV